MRAERRRTLYARAHDAREHYDNCVAELVGEALFGDSSTSYEVAKAAYEDALARLHEAAHELTDLLLDLRLDAAEQGNARELRRIDRALHARPQLKDF